VGVKTSGRPPLGHRAPVPDLVSIVDAAYEFTRPEEDWLRGVANAALGSLNRGGGLHAFLIDLGDVEFPVHTPVSVGLSPAWDRRWRKDWWDEFILATDSAALRRMVTYGPVTFATQIWQGVAAEIPTYRAYLEARARAGYGATLRRFTTDPTRASGDGMAYPDSFNVIGIDAGGVGVALVANLLSPAKQPVSVRTAEAWSRVAAHAATALRLRRVAGSARSLLGSADAILDTAGRVHHAVGDARDRSSIESIRRTAIAADRARRRRPRETSLGALEAWTALTRGRWSVVDQFDSNDRRFIVASRNAPVVTPRAGLSEREEQVARAVALGHSNKEIGYALGIAASTVANHLTGAIRKLGCRSRVDLIRLLNEGRKE